jgi:hypothetical protein
VGNPSRECIDRHQQPLSRLTFAQVELLHADIHSETPRATDGMRRHKEDL